MEMEEAFKLAQSETQIIRTRKNLLYTFGATRLPYICLSESLLRSGDVVVRRGEVLADRPHIAVPGMDFLFEGFEDADDAGGELAIMLARRISMPPSKYANKAGAEVFETGPLNAAVERAVNQLDRDNDVRTAVISAPEKVWGLSILLYVGSQVARSAPSNVQEHLERLRFQNDG